MNNHDKQNGQVILVFLFCLFASFMVMLFPSLRLKKMAMQHDAAVLRSANTSLIAWAVSRYPNKEQGKNIRLGEMVMPDKDPPSAKKSGGTQDSTARIGRLPWKTLGIPPLLDSHGEALWYTVSGRFRDNGLHTKTLHCQHLHQFRLYGGTQSAPMIDEDIMAVVIAPHRPLLYQPRYTPTQQKLPHHYIEVPSHFSFRQRYQYFIHGPVVKEGRVVNNDSTSALMCRVWERALQRRKEVVT